MATSTLIAENPMLPPARPLGTGRVILLGCLVCGIAAGMALLFGTEMGRQVRNLQQLREMGDDVRRWASRHPVATPFLFLTLYVTCSVLTLPVWWLQILSGYAWGLAAGVGWSLAGHTAGSVTTLYVSRWLGGEWVRAKAGRKLQKFQRLSQAMGNNGLLIVLGARILYFVPYGLSNYLFGVTHVRARDVAAGTVLGGFPVVATWVAIGAKPGVLADWRFWAVVIGSNLILLAPLVLRYRGQRRRARAARLAAAA